MPVFLRHSSLGSDVREYWMLGCEKISWMLLKAIKQEPMNWKKLAEHKGFKPASKSEANGGYSKASIGKI